MTTTITERLSGTPIVGSAVSDLAAIEALSGTGIPERTGQNDWTLRARTGADDTLVSGTAGATDRLAKWNSDGDLVEGPASPSGDIVGTNDAQTLTNKTIAAGSNSVSGLSVSMFAGTAIVTEAEGIASNDNDTSLPTSAAVKDYVDSAGSTAAASQGQMEAASSTSVFTSPGRQHFHPSACKFWLKANGDSASIEGSYNVSGTVDNGTGDLTVLLDTDFSSDDWCVQLTNEVDGDFDPNLHGIDSGNLLAGSVRCWTSDFDPGHWYVCGFGDQ